MAKIQIDTSADTRGAKRLNAELAKTDKELEEISKSARGAAGQARKLAEMADPQKKYNREMATLAKHVKAGRISLEEAEKVAAKYQRRMDRLGDSGRKALGGPFLASLASAYTGMASIGTITAQVQKGFGDLETAAQQAADKMVQSLDQIGQLQQLQDAPERLAFARELRRRGVVSSLGEGGDVAFQFKSSSLSKEDQLYMAEVAASKAVPSSGLAAFAAKTKKVQTNLGFASIQDTVNRLVQTSETADTGIEQIAEGSTRFADLLTGLGFSGDAGLAGYAQLIATSPNSDQAATRMQSYLTQVTKKGLAKGTFAETIRNIQQKVDAAGGNAFDVLGETNAVLGFQGLAKDMAFVENLTELNRTSSSRNVAGSRFGTLDADPEFKAARLTTVSEGELEDASRTLSRAENLLTTVSNYAIARQRRRGDEWSEWSIKSNRDWYDDYGQEVAGIRQTLLTEQDLVRKGASPYIPENVRTTAYEFLQENDALTGILKQIEANTRGGSAGRQE